MFLMQANLNIDLPPADPNRTGFNDTIALLRTRTLEFGGPVVLVHGDTHYFRVDKPLTRTSGTLAGRRIENFTRVEVFGSPDAHWMKVTVDPQNPNVFVFEPRVVPANVLPQ